MFADVMFDYKRYPVPYEINSKRLRNEVYYTQSAQVLKEQTERSMRVSFLDQEQT